MLVLTSGIAFAYSQYKTIDVIENKVTIYANENLVSVPNFTYNNTTYAPLRAVLELMECSAFYDEETNSVYAYNDYDDRAFPDAAYNFHYEYPYNTISKYAIDENGEYKISALYVDSIIFNEANGFKYEFSDDYVRFWDLDDFVNLGDITLSQDTSYGTSYTPSFGVSSHTAFPWHLYSNDGKEYLGKLVTDKYDSDSIWYNYGDYGSKYKSSSIWNTFGDYGSKYSNTSAFNEHATKPPKIVDNNGKLIGYLTSNEHITDGMTIEELSQLLKNNNQ